MKFQVPQFIDIEDKIFGPLSFKEFSYVAGGAGLSYILYRYIPSFIGALFLIVPILAFSAALAFWRPNNKPFIEMVQAALLYAMGRKLYIWKKDKDPLRTKEIDPTSGMNSSIKLPNYTENKLANLNWSLDTQGKKETNNQNPGLNLKI